jgi:glycosyltransferase involved in cell wall biosynthesis
MEPKKLNISFFSNSPLTPTGYGVQTRINYPRIKSLGYPLTISCNYGLQGSRTVLQDGTLMYPLGKHKYGQDVIGAHAENAGANCIISLYDVPVFEPQNFRKIDWFPWFPCDTEPVSNIIYEKLSVARKPIAMSKLAKKMAEDRGISCFYVPHSVETKVFKPIDRNAARARLGFPKDKFIVGMVAANKGADCRKSFFEHITAYAAFHAKNPDSLLYLHTDEGSFGMDLVNLVNYCKALGLKIGYTCIPDEQGKLKPICDDVDVAFPMQYMYLLGMPDLYMVDVYNSLDVMMLASMGEGFGIPLIEAQACGCPVITGDWTAMGELCFSGWKIPKEQAIQTWQNEYGAWRWRVNVDALVDRLLLAYEVKNNQDYRDRARKGAMEYDADRVALHYWKPTLEAIEDLVCNTKSKMELVTF